MIAPFLFVLLLKEAAAKKSPGTVESKGKLRADTGGIGIKSDLGKRTTGCVTKKYHSVLFICDKDVTFK